jgi:hypothetical protein
MLHTCVKGAKEKLVRQPHMASLFLFETIIMLASKAVRPRLRVDCAGAVTPERFWQQDPHIYSAQSTVKSKDVVLCSGLCRYSVGDPFSSPLMHTLIPTTPADMRIFLPASTEEGNKSSVPSTTGRSTQLVQKEMAAASSSTRVSPNSTISTIFSTSTTRIAWERFASTCKNKANQKHTSCRWDEISSPRAKRTHRKYLILHVFMYMQVDHRGGIRGAGVCRCMCRIDPVPVEQGALQTHICGGRNRGFSGGES